MIYVKVLESGKQIIVSHVGSNDITDVTEYVLSIAGSIEYYFADGYILLKKYGKCFVCIHFDMIEIEK
jgi:hypothetical protein